MPRFVVSDNFDRPGDTTQYADKDLVANSTTAGSVSPLSWVVAKQNGGYFRVLGARMIKDDNDITAATFRIHLWTVAPTPTAGDNGALADATGAANYLGYIAVDMSTAGLLAFGDGNVGWGTPNGFSDHGLHAKCASGDNKIYGLVEAKGTYTPASGENVAVELHIENYYAAGRQ